MADILASVSVVLGAEISGFRAAMANARRELSGLVKFSEGLKDIGTSLTQYVTLPVAALTAASLKVGGDFQAAFNRVQAATQATGADLAALRQKAQGIALDPNLQFSSVQAAQALENLAKNGASTRDILGGAVDATTALATATGAQLAVAADITTDVMNNFGRSAQEAAGLVSNITGATVASKFSIDDYRQALGQAGAVAGQLGASFEDFNTALSLTSSGFSSGSDAGTSFKTFLQRLVPQSKEAAAAMEKLGLNFFDAQGKLLPLRDVAGLLQKSFAGLSDQAKNTFGTQIFGADSIRTALLLAKAGSAGFDEMAASIGKVNAAAQGAILNQGFTGGLEAFKSAAEGLGQAVADSGLLAFFDGLLRRGAALAASLAQLNPTVLATGTVLAGLAAAVGPVAVALGTLGAALPAIRAGIVEVKAATLLLQNNMVVLRGALAAVLSPTGAIVAALVTLGAVIYAANTEGQRAYETFQKQVQATRALDGSLTPLLDRYDTLKSKTTLSAAEQEELRSVVQQVTAIMPEAGTKIDEYGNFIDLAASKARKAVSTFQGLDKAFALSSLPAARTQLKELESQYAFLQRAAAQVNETGKLNGVALSSLGAKGAAENIGYLRQDIAKVGEALEKQRKQVKDFEEAAGLLGNTIGGPLKQALTDADIALKFFGASLGDAAKKTGLLADLEARLKTAKDARPGLSTEKDIAASNALEASLEQQIKRLNDLGNAQRENAKAFRDLGRESLALGDQFKYLEARRDADLAGIKRLLAAGYAPHSAAVRALTADYNRLNTTILGASEVLTARMVKGSEKLFETPEFKVNVPKLALPQTVAKFDVKFDDIAAPALPDYGAIFGTAAQQIAAGSGELRAAFVPVTQAQLDFNTQMGELSESLSNSVGPLLAGFAVQAADAFGSFATGAASLGDAMQGLFGGILQSLSSFMSDFGQKLIVIGIGKQALDLLFKGPQGGPLAIAAGVGLLALAGVASAASKSLSSSLSSSIGSGGASSGSISTGASNYGQNTSAQPIKVVAELKLRGPDLVAVLRGDTYRTKLTV
jgi:TP901 family phage tail tape measure protein